MRKTWPLRSLQKQIQLLPVELAVAYVHELFLRDVAALAEEAGPQLHADDAEDEEDEEAEEEHVPQHGQRVQQQHHQYAHAWGEERSQ